MTTLLSCGFCGKTQKQVVKLLAGDAGMHICDECVDLCHGVLKQQKLDNESHQRKNRLNRQFRTIEPKEIHKELNKHVIGQERVKKGVSVAVYNHCKRIFKKTKVDIQKSNLLMIGPTGVGKTLIAQTLANYLGVPMVITDATVITESGYAGEDAEVLIHKLFQNSNYDKELAEIGIIYVDEIDKKAKRNDYVSLSRDVSGEGVQQSLLKLMEGTTVKVPNKPGMNPEKIEINTKNILFMVGGAFVGLDSVVLQRVGKNKIGFDSASKLDEDLWVDFLETQDLVSYGLIPEFVGRVPSVNVLKDLRREELLQVLTEPENSIIKQYQALFELDKIQLEFNIKALEEIVDIAMKQDLGARGLRKILDDALLEIQYSLPDYRSQNVERMVITHDTIKDGKKPLLIKGNNT